jgi:hypothetical protein
MLNLRTKKNNITISRSDLVGSQDTSRADNMSQTDANPEVNVVDAEIAESELTTEDAAREVSVMLENTGKNLEKFLGFASNSESTNKPTFYSEVKEVSEKHKHFERNLVLVREGSQALNEATQEYLDRKLISPAKPTT